VRAVEREPLAGRILPTALTLFGEHGYHGTSMQRIADALGVTRAAFYYHYASKQDLLRALAEPLVAEFEILAERSAGQRHDVDTVLAGYLDVVLAHSRILRFVANDAAVQADADIGVRLRSSYERITGALAASADGPEPEVRAACALGAITAGVTEGRSSADHRSLILAAAHAALACSVPAQ
jgi:AcrR family transcriptional regulator